MLPHKRAVSIGGALALLMVAETYILWPVEMRRWPEARPVFHALRLIPVACGFCLWLADTPTVRRRDAVQAVVVIGALAGAGDFAAYALHAAQDAAADARETRRATRGKG